MCTSAVFACNGWIPRVHITPTKRTHETAVRFHAKMPECPLCLWWGVGAIAKRRQKPADPDHMTKTQHLEFN